MILQSAKAHFACMYQFCHDGLQMALQSVLQSQVFLSCTAFSCNMAQTANWHKINSKLNTSSLGISATHVKQ